MRPAVVPSDEDLFRRLRQGDESAFTVLYRRWQGPLYRFALRMIGRPSAAEDAVQETFMTLLDGESGFDPSRGALSSYLFGVARHRVLKRLERERPYLPLPETGDGFLSVLVAPDDPMADLIRRERITRVWNAVLSLPLHYREAVALCDLQHMTYEEAAAALGCAVGTVRSRLHRGREMLLGKLRVVSDAASALRRVPSAG